MRIRFYHRRRGGNGPLKVARGAYPNPLYDAFLQAGAQARQVVSDDLNGRKCDGVARLDATKSTSRRCSAVVAFLKPTMSRKNLVLRTGAEARRILIEGSRAAGIVYVHKGVSRTSRATGEGILTGGISQSAVPFWSFGV